MQRVKNCFIKTHGYFCFKNSVFGNCRLLHVLHRKKVACVASENGKWKWAIWLYKLSLWERSALLHMSHRNNFNVHRAKSFGGPCLVWSRIHVWGACSDASPPFVWASVPTRFRRHWRIAFSYSSRIQRASTLPRLVAHLLCNRKALLLLLGGLGNVPQRLIRVAEVPVRPALPLLVILLVQSCC